MLLAALLLVAGPVLAQQVEDAPPEEARQRQAEIDKAERLREMGRNPALVPIPPQFLPPGTSAPSFAAPNAPAATAPTEPPAR